MFVKTTDFLKAKGTLSKRDIELMLPMLVLEAFSIELLLKCLLLLDGKNVPKSHGLAVLFRQIGPKLKRRVIDAWEASGCRLQLTQAGKELNFPTDLPNALVRCDRAFEQLRYGYEDPKGSIFYLGNLPRVLIGVIAELKNDWIVFVDVD